MNVVDHPTYKADREKAARAHAFELDGIYVHGLGWRTAFAVGTTVHLVYAMESEDPFEPARITRGTIEF